MTVRRPAILLACLAALLALAVTACGGGGSGQSALPPVELTSFATAAKASSASESARFSLSFSQSLPGTDQALAFGASGAFDTKANRARLEFDLSAFVELLAGLGEAFGGTVTGDLPTDPDDWKLEALQDGDVLYVRFPLLADQLPDGKTWIRGDAKDLVDQAGGGLDQFGSLAETDPRDAFAYLEAVAGGIETVGTEELRGVATTHYRATVDVAKALELVPAEQRNGLTDLDQMLGQSGLSQIPIDVWLDAEQRVHKFEMAFDLGAPGSGESARSALTMEVWDYGAPLELELPPPDQVVDASALPRP
jgi:hypothetical protein